MEHFRPSYGCTAEKNISVSHSADHLKKAVVGGEYPMEDVDCRVPGGVSIGQGDRKMQHRSAAGDASYCTDMQREQTLEQLDTMADSELRVR
jgi:hypothetical protein